MARMDAICAGRGRTADRAPHRTRRCIQLGQVRPCAILLPECGASGVLHYLVQSFREIPGGSSTVAIGSKCIALTLVSPTDESAVDLRDRNSSSSTLTQCNASGSLSASDPNQRLNMQHSALLPFTDDEELGRGCVAGSEPRGARRSPEEPGVTITSDLGCVVLGWDVQRHATQRNATQRRIINRVNRAAPDARGRRMEP